MQHGHASFEYAIWGGNMDMKNKMCRSWRRPSADDLNRQRPYELIEHGLESKVEEGEMGRRHFRLKMGSSGSNAMAKVISVDAQTVTDRRDRDEAIRELHNCTVAVDACLDVLAKEHPGATFLAAIMRGQSYGALVSARSREGDHFIGSSAMNRAEDLAELVAGLPPELADIFRNELSWGDDWTAATTSAEIADALAAMLTRKVWSLTEHHGVTKLIWARVIAELHAAYFDRFSERVEVDDGTPSPAR
jgi:hypothetical protein